MVIKMQKEPFWESLYADPEVSAFSKGPTVDVNEFYDLFPKGAKVLDVGCGEGRNSIFMAKIGHEVDAFDVSENAVEKAKKIARQTGGPGSFF